MTNNLPTQRFVFPVPTFNKDIAGKIHRNLAIDQANCSKVTNNSGSWNSAIASDGIPTRCNGVHVMCLKVDRIQKGALAVGFTSVASYNTADKNPFIGWNEELPGISLYAWDSKLYFGSGSSQTYFDKNNQLLKAKEIISILTVSGVGTGGFKIEVKWIMDGNTSDCKSIDCTHRFRHVEEIFPAVTLGYAGDSIRFIPIDQVSNRSDKIREMITKFELSKKDQSIIKAPQANSPSFTDCLANILNGLNVDVAFFGLAGTGKSVLFNSLIRTLYGKYIPDSRTVGIATDDQGQCSKSSQRESVSSHLEGAWVKKNGDFFFRDSVGFAGDHAEFMAIMQGKFSNTESWPRRNKADDDEDHRAWIRSEISKRSVNNSQHVTCVALCISAVHLLNPMDKKLLDINRNIIEWTKTFEPEVPLLLLITQCDQQTAEGEDVEPKDLLEQHNSFKLAALFKKANDRFSIPVTQMIALGFLDQCTDIDWSDKSRDPRSLAVRHAFLTVAQAGRICRQRMNNILSSSPSATPIHSSADENSLMSWRRNVNDDDASNFASEDTESQVNGATTVASSIGTESAADRRRYVHAVNADQKRSGLSWKNYIKTLDNGELAGLLACKNVSKPIIDLIIAKSYSGSIFARDNFVARCFNGQTIDELIVEDFVDIRETLLSQ